jgi:hypothetical protein
MDSLALDNYVAAAGNAVHAGIAAADVIAASRVSTLRPAVTWNQLVDQMAAEPRRSYVISYL